MYLESPPGGWVELVTEEIEDSFRYPNDGFWVGSNKPSQLMLDSRILEPFTHVNSHMW
jgi:hypothetical protein